MSRVPTAPPLLSVGFLLLPQFTLTPFAGMVDVLRLAADVGDRSRQIHCRWEVLSAAQAPIPASCGFEIRPTARLNTTDHFDYIVVVGGLLFDGPRLAPEEATFLRRRAAEGARLIGVCTGSFEMIDLGLMRDRPCCVSWFHVADLLDRYPDARPVSDRLYLDDGDRITCAGGAGAAQLCADLVARHCGAQQASKAMRILMVDRSEPGHGPQPLAAPSSPSLSDRIRRALLVMEETIAAPLPIESIARRLGVSARQLERDFQDEFGYGPYAANLGVRLEHARVLLTAGSAPITAVALACGFADASHMAKRFRERFAVTPTGYRRHVQDLMRQERATAGAATTRQISPRDP